MKKIAYALLAIMMVATALGDPGTPLWVGAWKCNYAGTTVYLVITENLNGYVCPNVEGDVQSVATLTGGKVSDDGATYTATWTLETTAPLDEGDTCAFKLTRTKPTEFKGTVTWPDNHFLPFNGEWYGTVKPPE